MLVGHPVRHSVSPAFQNEALRAMGIPVAYEALDVPPSELEPRLAALVAEGAAGNVTVPYKMTVAARCDRRTALAERVGAVNTFWVEEDGALVGDNTDVDGFASLAAALLGAPSPGARVAVLGAGGAAAAVLAAVERWPRSAVTLWNRTRERAERLAARFPVVRSVAASPEECVRGCTLVVNATTVGLTGDDTPVSPGALEPGCAVADLVYRSGGGTPWVHAVQASGRRAADGLVMLVEQGALAFERWFGVPAPRDVMRHAACSAR